MRSRSRGRLWQISMDDTGIQAAADSSTGALYSILPRASNVINTVLS